MDAKLIEKLKCQAREMARKTNISVEQAYTILVRGRSWAKKPSILTEEEMYGTTKTKAEQPVETEEADSSAGTFERQISDAVKSGVDPDVAFQQVVRQHPTEAREYFKKILKGEK